MTSRLKKKLDNIGVDASSSKLTESFCLVRYSLTVDLLGSVAHLLRTDWYSASVTRQGQGRKRICASLETGCTVSSLTLSVLNVYLNYV